MRVLHLSTSSSWRGGEQQILYLCRGLRELGQDQLVVCQDGSDAVTRFKNEGIVVREISMRGELDFLAAYRLSRVAREFGANLIHAHTARAHSLGLLSSLFTRLPLFVSRRVDFPARGNILSRLKYRSPRVTVFIAISQNVRNILVKDGIAPQRIRVAYSGIDPDRFRDLPAARALRTQYGLKNRLVLGNVAALVDHKDQSTLLRSLWLLKQRTDVPPFTCLIVGSGERELRLKSLAYEELQLSASDVVFCGFQKDILPYFALFDIFVMSSREEGLGTSVLDAMASGLPVVSTTGGGLPEMVDEGQGGLLSAPGDPGALCASLARMLGEADLRERCGRYNQSRVRDFHFRQTAKQTLEIYKEFL
ncbi:MAG: glycosyltransferase family 4 protein [Spirochaetales bacterium]|nr:glycosyltransferase family 4 protein [Spirochaetales bacterium]